MAKKKEVDKITEFVRLANKVGLTYGQLQQLEILGKAKVVKGHLILNGVVY